MTQITYDLPDWNQAAPRYTSLDEVKTAIAIPLADTTWDAAITQAIVAAEVALDANLGRSFPDRGVLQLDARWVSIGEGSLAADPGEVSSFAVTSVELAKTDFDGVDHDGLVLADVTTVVIGAFVFDVSSFVETSTLWTFTGTVGAGAFPAAGVGVVVDVPALAFPDDGVVRVVPEAIAQVSLNASMAAFKANDAPFGTAGSDAFFGTVAVADIVRAEVDRNPLMVGLMVSWGVA